MNQLIKKDYIYILFFLAIGIIFRLPFLEKMQSHWDGPQYTIAILNYSLVNHTPAPPGYPIYIGLGKFINLFTNDAHLSILLVSLIAGAISSAFFYYLCFKFFNRAVGTISALLLISGPTFYFFAITANPYGILPITAGALALTVYTIKKKGGHGIILGLVYAISIGIRPQDGIFLTPLFLYGLYLCDNKNRVYTLLSMFAGILIWIFPLFLAAGGPNQYLQLLGDYQNKALTGFSFTNIYSVRYIIIKGLFLSFTFANLFLLLYFYDFFKFLKIKNKLLYLVNNDYIIIFALWIFPSLFFNAFVRSDHAAHQMTYLSAFLVLIAYAIWRVFKNQKKLLWTIVILLFLFNLFTFFRDRDPEMNKPYIPQSYHYSEIIKNNIRMESKIDYINNNYNPEEVIILTSYEMFRPYTYYLKNYEVIAINAFKSNTIPHANDIYIGKNWKMKSLNRKNHIINLPSDIKKVVIMDEESKDWIKNENFKTINLAANSSLSEIESTNYTQILYGFKSVVVK